MTQSDAGRPCTVPLWHGLDYAGDRTGSGQQHLSNIEHAARELRLRFEYVLIMPSNTRLVLHGAEVRRWRCGDRNRVLHPVNLGSTQDQWIAAPPRPERHVSSDRAFSPPPPPVRALHRRGTLLALDGVEELRPLVPRLGPRHRARGGPSAASAAPTRARRCDQQGTLAHGRRTLRLRRRRRRIRRARGVRRRRRLRRRRVRRRRRRRAARKGSGARRVPLRVPGVRRTLAPTHRGRLLTVRRARRVVTHRHRRTATRRTLGGCATRAGICRLRTRSGRRSAPRAGTTRATR